MQTFSVRRRQSFISPRLTWLAAQHHNPLILRGVYDPSTPYASGPLFICPPQAASDAPCGLLPHVADRRAAPLYAKWRRLFLRRRATCATLHLLHPSSSLAACRRATPCHSPPITTYLRHPTWQSFLCILGVPISAPSADPRAINEPQCAAPPSHPCLCSGGDLIDMNLSLPSDLRGHPFRLGACFRLAPETNQKGKYHRGKVSS
jgi:hypothetical protein